MKKNKIIALAAVCLLVAGLAGCSKGADKTTNETTSAVAQTEAATTQTEAAPSETATEIKTTAAQIDMATATPKELIDLAKSQMQTASAEEKTTLIQSIFNSQKKYLEEVAPSYEEANSNTEFMDIYALDITKELVDKITDSNIKKLVTDTYDNGLILQKAEGYVYPVIDIKLYQDEFLSNMPESDGKALEAEINKFNAGL
ncbi:MAG: hypothetical protein RR768_07770 [Clostridium sp.]